MTLAAPVTIDLRDGAGIANAERGGASLTSVSGALSVLGGPLTPGGSSVGSTSVEGSLSLGGGLMATISGPGVNDLVVVTGTVALDGPLTLVIGGYVPDPTAEFLLLRNDGSDAVIGNFSDLPEGAPVTVGGVPCVISYTGGDGNDIVLRVGSAGSNIYLPLIAN